MNDDVIMNMYINVLSIRPIKFLLLQLEKTTEIIMKQLVKNTDINIITITAIIAIYKEIISRLILYYDKMYNRYCILLTKNIIYGNNLTMII